MDLGEIANCFGCSKSVSICIKVHFLTVEPCQEFVWFHCMLEVVKGPIAVDLASKMDPIVLCFSVVFPVATEELLKAILVTGNLSFPIICVLVPSSVVTVIPGSSFAIVSMSILAFSIGLYMDFCVGLVPRVSVVIKICIG